MKMSSLVSDYPTYTNGKIYLLKIKGDPYDKYRCMGCHKTWLSTAKRMGHGEAACRRNR
jgi:hypothetical protein